MSDQKKSPTPQFDEGSLGSFADFYDELESDLLLDPELAIQRDFMRYGERVRELRRRKGFSQVRLSEMSGLRQALISDIENGVMKDGPTQRSMLKLSYALEDPSLAGLSPADRAYKINTLEVGQGVNLYVTPSEESQITADAIEQWRKGLLTKKRFPAKWFVSEKAATKLNVGDKVIVSGGEAAGFTEVLLAGGRMMVTFNDHSPGTEEEKAAGVYIGKKPREAGIRTYSPTKGVKRHPKRGSKSQST